MHIIDKTFEVYTVWKYAEFVLVAASLKHCRRSATDGKAYGNGRLVSEININREIKWL